MATTKIQGMVIDIGANTGPLKTAFEDINKSLSSTQKELNLVEKLLKLDPSNVELLTQKQKLLEDQLSNSREKFSRLHDIMLQLEQRRFNGEDVAKEMRAVERESIATEQQIQKLDTAFQEVNKSVFELDGKAKGAVESEKELGKSTSDASEVIKNTGVIANEAYIQTLESMSSAASDVVGKLWDLAINAGKSADDINTLAAQTGLTTEEIQKFQYASDLIDVSMETLTGSMSKMIKNMATAQKGTGDAAAAFKKLHVRIEGAGGKLRDSQTVFDETINALSKVRNETERDALAMQIFGKSARDLNPLILGGADALKELGDQAEAAGLILSQDALDQANAFNDVMDTLNASLQQVGMLLGSALAEAIMQMIPKLEPFVNLLVGLVDLISNIPAPVLVIIGMIIALVPLILKTLQAMTMVKQFMAAFDVQGMKTTLIILGITAAVLALIAAFAWFIGKEKSLQNTMNSMTNSFSGLKDQVFDVQNGGSGGKATRYASGTKYHRGGGAIITEYGAEQLTLPNGSQYVVMPRGTKVDNARQTQGVLGGGDTYYISIDAKSVQEFNDIVRIAKNQRQMYRMGYVRG